jgi:hypothetical protein
MTVSALALTTLFLQAPAPDEAASLVPADAAILVRVESLAGMAELVNAFAEVGQDEPVVPARILGDLPYPGPAENVDPTRPVYLAISFAPDQPAPGMTWIVPARSGTPLGLDNSDGAFTLHVAGDYTSITSRPGVARPSAPSLLVAALRPGLVAVHLDLATLIERFRPLIDMGLRQAETGLDSLPTDPSVPFDPSEMFEWYFGFARECLASAEALELALGRAGETLTLRGRYRVKAGSPQEFARVETVALAPLAGLVDPEAPMQMAVNGSWKDMLSTVSDLMETAVGMYPEPFRTDLERVLTLQESLADVLLPGIAMASDFTTEGVRLCYVLRARDPERALAGIEEMMRAFDHGDGFAAVGPAERLVLAGFEGRVLPLEFRREAFAKFLALGQEPEAGLDQEVEEMMTTLYGRNLRLALATRGEFVAVALGNNDSVLRADLERLAHPALAAPKMLSLADELPPGAFGFVQHIDLGRTLGRMMAATRGVMALPFGVFPERDFALDFWGSALEREYTGGVRMDLAELLAFAHALREFEGR